MAPGRGPDAGGGAAAAAASASPSPNAHLVARAVLPPPLHAVCAQAVQAPTKSDVGNVNDVGLKDVPLRSLFPEEPATPRPVRVDRPRQRQTLPGCSPAAWVAGGPWACRWLRVVQPPQSCSSAVPLLCLAWLMCPSACPLHVQGPVCARHSVLVHVTPWSRPPIVRCLETALPPAGRAQAQGGDCGQRAGWPVHCCGAAGPGGC